MARSASLALALCLAGAAAGVRAEWILRETPIMGTRCAVEIWSPDRARGEALIEQVFEEMRRVDRLMSHYKPDSQLSQINARAAREPVRVDPELYRLIQASLDVSRRTDGAFDITYASVGYRYDFRARRRPDAGTIASELPGIDWRHVELSPADFSVRFTRPGTRIDLGGIAKGYAVDRGIAILRAGGIERAMVNAGGDTRILGDRFDKPWMVGIRNPDDARGVALRVPLSDAAISTSGDYERYFDEGGVRYHHIIDPKTGDSARRVRSATVIGPDATQTDALSTTVFVMGPEAGIALIDGMPGFDAIVITPQGKVLYSKGLAPP